MFGTRVSACSQSLDRDGTRPLRYSLMQLVLLGLVILLYRDRRYQQGVR